VLSAAGVPVFTCSLALLQSITGFNIHRGCLAIGDRPAAVPPVALMQGRGPLVVLEGIGNPDNVGLIFRNAAAFGVSGVVVGAGCCDPLYRKAIRTSMGAALTVPFAVDDEWPGALAQLRGARWTVIGMTPDAGARPIDDVRMGRDARVAVLLGSEGEGLSTAAMSAADERVRIPMCGTTDSLNVAVAAGVALYALTREDRRT
jgi:tRNA G18 (ribose-2'-O)-methylase SpoU